ncbi:uncharacterized protein VDAG_05744 [Verticillium dahliae VdLs.17]|uniref:Uncharacterized protein n=1 Tax=Verticillium dahliae (strain VdLs.17 / ATCC MYA-4575 / FGSC 10137) TaxID=498257 RepID=G2X6G2_VERDV|nr:uncharacterized protein VDAG_05744 [Verticillium dahliae VdLs.17]EGY14580.1 hypothetical protein VDAG_05744 [Verticillium dahliae VdLs.17]
MLSAACNVHLRSWWLLLLVLVLVLLLLLAASTSGRPMQVHRLCPARTSQVSARVQVAPESSSVASNRRLDRAVGRLVWYQRGTRQSCSKTPDTPLQEVPTPPVNTAHNSSITLLYVGTIHFQAMAGQAGLGWAWTLRVPSLCPLFEFA